VGAAVLDGVLVVTVVGFVVVVVTELEGVVVALPGTHCE